MNSGNTLSPFPVQFEGNAEEYSSSNCPGDGGVTDFLISTSFANIQYFEELNFFYTREYNIFVREVLIQEELFPGTCTI